MTDRQDDLPRDVSAATERQDLFGLLKWKNRLNEGSKLAVVDGLRGAGHRA
jgi:hypothetical protein